MERTSKSNVRSPAAWAAFVLTVVIGLALDLWTKVWAFSELAVDVVQVDGRVELIGTSVHRFIPGWVHFHLAANQGAVFGLGQGHRALFLFVSVVAIAFLTYLFATGPRSRFYQIVLGMLLAGVLGNMYDRLFLGYVRDMIYIFPGWENPIRGWLPEDHAWQELFPWIFNVADVLLCVGVSLMVIYSLFFAPDDKADAREPEDAPRSHEATKNP